MSELAVLVIAAYRSEGLPRDHMLRGIRHELRRAGRLDELRLSALEPAETGVLLAKIFEQVPAPTLVREIHDRTQGVPFFVEELARALLVRNALTARPRGLELAIAG